MYHKYSQLAADKLCFAQAVPKSQRSKISVQEYSELHMENGKTELKVQTAHRTAHSVLSKFDSFADFFAEGEKQVHGTSTRFFFFEEEGLAKFLEIFVGPCLRIFSPPVVP